MAMNALTVVDHIVALADYARRVQPELTKEQAFIEALVAYRRYGMRAEDVR